MKGFICFDLKNVGFILKVNFNMGDSKMKRLGVYGEILARYLERSDLGKVLGNWCKVYFE